MKKIILLFIIGISLSINCYAFDLGDALRKEFNSRPPILDSWYGNYNYKDEEYNCDINVDPVMQKPHIRVFIDYKYQKKYQVMIGPFIINNINKNKSVWKTSQGNELILNKSGNKIKLSLDYGNLNNIKFRVYKNDPMTEKFEKTSIEDPIIKKDLDYLSKMTFTKK